MQLISNMIVGILAILAILAAFVYILHPKVVFGLLRKTSIPLSVLLLLLGFLSEWFGSADGFALVVMIAITSLIAYWILKRRRPDKKSMARAVGTERKPLMPRTSLNEEGIRDEEFF